MNSPKENTQRRMLNYHSPVSSPKLAKFTTQSPNNRIAIRKIESKTSAGSTESIRDTTKSKSRESNTEEVPRRVISNFEHGEVELKNGDRYEGEMKNGKMYGKGTYYFKHENLKYTGEFYDNLFHGWGSIKKNDGSESLIYQGNFEYGKKHGEGKYKYGPNHFYKGNWAFDMKNGKGIYQFPEGCYNGEWERNKKQGEGTLKLNNGTEFKGQFILNQFVKGLIKYPNGDEYSGDVVNNQREGEGSYFSVETQERYKGQWKNNKRHGKGIVFMRDGDELHCSFLQGKIDETQSCTYKWNSNSDEESIFIGWFKNGKPEKGHITQKNGQEFDIY